LVQIVQPMQISRLISGRKVRQEPVLFFNEVLGWTIKVFFMVLNY